MNPAVLSLLALIVALVVSMTSRINVGWLAIAFAWLVGVYAAGLRPDVVLAGFPAALFLTLAGVTLLFGIAETNGTLEGLATRALSLTRGRDRAVPVVLFVVACLLSSVGPGAVSTVALLAPMAMSVGARAGILPLLTALMVANGANAGNLSPFSSVGVIANGAMVKAGLVGFEGRVWFANFAAHLLVAGAAFAWLGFRAAPPEDGSAVRPAASIAPAFNRQQRVTLVVVGLWIAGVLVLNLNLGLSAFAASVVLLISEHGRRVRVGEEDSVVNHHDGVRRLGSDRRARKDRRHGSLHRVDGACLVAANAERRHRVRDRKHLHI